MSSATLVSPGVSVTIATQGAAGIPSPTTIPLLFIATRANKLTPDGTAIARGTTESNVLEIFTSQTELLQAYGNIVFAESDGVPVIYDETNEVGLLTAYTTVALTNEVMIVRAPIDLGQLVPSTVAPVLPPPDGTFWMNTNAIVGGILTFNGTVWSVVPFDIFTTTPTPSQGSNGDWAFDYSTLNGQLIFKHSGTWFPATTTNIETVLSATNPLWVGPSTPVGAVSGDFWFKTSSSNSGINLAISQYRAGDQVWVSQPVIFSSTPPAPTQNAIWEDNSQLATTGNRPLYLGTGTEFINLPIFIQSTPPVTPPATGTYWFNNSILDFALYVENGNLWYPVTTTTVSNPSGLQKVISASAPAYPSVNAIWVQVDTAFNIDNYPVINMWTGSAWINITENVYIQSNDPGASLVANNSYWLNTGESRTTNTVKIYDPTYVAHTVNGSGQTVVETGNYWAPDTGKIFGRLSQRAKVVDAINEVIVSNSEIRAEVNYYQLIAAPGYPETYNNISQLNIDNGQISLCIFDVPKWVQPDGVSSGRNITLTDWINDVRTVSETGEQGFSGAPDPFQANAYPGGLATNPTDGTQVYVPPSYILLNCIAFNDSVAFPWYPPAGPNRGLVTTVSSVGYLTDINPALPGVYKPINLNRGQRDIAYTHAVNPISNIPNVGLCLWGQKTMSVAGLITDRINVIRLLAKMKYDLQRLMEPFLFELNNAATRRNAEIVAQRYLAGLAALNAIYDYSVLCDSTNNTPSVVASHQLIVDIAIQPEISIEFIYVPILVLYPDQSLPF